MAPAIRRFWLACAVSLCLHGSLGFFLLRTSLRLTGSESGPVRVGAVRFDIPDEPLPLTVLPSSPQPPTALPPAVVSAAVPLANTLASPATTPRSEGADLIVASLAPRAAAAAAPRAGTTAPAFFNVPVRGQSVVYVLDRSLSMGQNGGLRLRTVKRELLASLSRLPATSRFQVIFYNGQASTLDLSGRPGLATASDENKRLAAEQIELLAAEGGTKHLPALQLALSLEPDVIYFLTDAGGLTPGLIREVTRLNRRRCIIHTFEMTSDADADTPLKTLARQNRGEYHLLSLR